MCHKLISSLFALIMSTSVFCGCSKKETIKVINDSEETAAVEHEHTFKDVWSADSTSHWHESTCEHTDVTRDRAPHQFDLVENVNPTYSSAGHKKYICLVCQYVNEVTLNQLNHTYSDEWTSNEQGHWHACLDEGFESSKIDYEVHTFTTSVVQPTFETEGSITYTCTKCDYVTSTKIPVNDHAYEEEWSTDEHGHWHACKDEGYETEQADYQDHSYKITTKDSTFDLVGVKTYTCVECGYSFEVEIPLKKHSYSNTYSFDESCHWHQCVDVGYTNLKIDNEIHNFTIEQFDPTYESEGYRRYTCSDCGYAYISKYSDPLEHNFDHNWQNNNYYHWHVCTDEGYESLKGSYGVHNYNYEIIEPGPYTEGLIQRTCVDCGFYYETTTPSLFDQCAGNWCFSYNSYENTYTFTGFNNSDTLTVAYIPDRYYDVPVTRISAYSLEIPTLEKVYIGDNVTSLDYDAFGGNYSPSLQYLKSISFGESLTYTDVRELFPNIKQIRYGRSVSYYSWYNDFSSLESIIFSDEHPTYKSIDGLVLTKNGQTLYKCPRGRKGDVMIPDGVVTIGSSAFSNCINVTSISFENPDLITAINSSAFYWCTSLEELTNFLPNLERIESQAFYYTKLRYISLPTTLNYLGSYCLYVMYPYAYQFYIYYDGTSGEFWDYITFDGDLSPYYLNFVFLGDA